MTRTAEDTMESLTDTAAENPLTVGHYIQAAWNWGLLVTGCIGAADGARLAPMYDDAAAQDRTPATLTAALPANITPPWDANGTGETYEGYRPILAVVDGEGEPQAILWREVTQ